MRSSLLATTSRQILIMANKYTAKNPFYLYVNSLLFNQLICIPLFTICETCPSSVLEWGCSPYLSLYSRGRGCSYIAAQFHFIRPVTSLAGLQFFRFGEGSGLNAGNVLCSQTRDLQQQFCATMCAADAAQVLLIPAAAGIKSQ